MSRIGNKAVEIPDKVKVNIGNDGAVAGMSTLDRAFPGHTAMGFALPDTTRA